MLFMRDGELTWIDHKELSGALNNNQMEGLIMAKALVAYFSASGVTKKLSENLAGAIGADLFEIVPVDPYTDADLNWRDKNSRSSIEMNDRSCRPAIATRVEDMAQYDTVFVGFPVWWYRQPSIIDTFLESYDFAGKKIVPFCTSGGSGLGQAPEYMQELVPAANVLMGRRLSANVSEEELKNWVEGV